SNGEFTVISVTGCVDSHCATRIAVAVEGDTGLSADLLECAIMLIEEQEIRNGVVGDHEIDPAITVDIDRRDAEGLGGRHAGRRVFHLQSARNGNIAEMTAAVVMVEARKSAGEIH